MSKDKNTKLNKADKSIPIIDNSRLKQLEKQDRGKIRRKCLFNSPEELQMLFDKYFDECNKKDKVYTMTGLAMYLGLTRKTLLQFQGKKQYKKMIEDAKEKVRQFIEDRLVNSKQNTAGLIFWLKNNAEWEDKNYLSGDKSEPIRIVIKKEN